MVGGRTSEDFGCGLAVWPSGFRFAGASRDFDDLRVPAAESANRRL